jgi:undecaprenyl-diphosphatase
MLLFDAPVFHFLNANTQSPLWWIQASRFASNWLPGLCALPVIAAMLALGKGWRRSLQLALLSMACAWVTCRLIRCLPMPRPAQLGMGMQWIAHGASASFPSMHAAGAFALAQGINLGVGRHQRWLVVVAWLLATSVALSRVVLGVHFLRTFWPACWSVRQRRAGLAQRPAAQTSAAPQTAQAPPATPDHLKHATKTKAASALFISTGSFLMRHASSQRHRARAASQRRCRPPRGKRHSRSGAHSTLQILSILVPPGWPMGSPQVMA